MKFPIIAFCEGDLAIFDAVEKACSDMEPIDVRMNRWIAYDADGNRLRIRVEQVRPQGLLNRCFTTTIEKTRIDSDPTASARPLDLHEHLDRYFRKLPDPHRFGISQEWIASASTSDLVRAARKLA